MIEEIVSLYLDNSLGVSVYAERPDEPPGSYIIIEKTGGGVSDHIRRATLAIQSYGATMHQAAQLNERVIEAMNGLISLNSVTRSQLNSDYNFTDPQTKEYRYQCVYDITYY